MAGHAARQCKSRYAESELLIFNSTAGRLELLLPGRLSDPSSLASLARGLSLCFLPWTASLRVELGLFERSGLTIIINKSNAQEAFSWRFCRGARGARALLAVHQEVPLSLPPPQPNQIQIKPKKPILRAHLERNQHALLQRIRWKNDQVTRWRQ